MEAGRSGDGRRRNDRLNLSKRVGRVDLAVGLSGCAVARDVASLATPVADFAGSVQGTSIRSGAVTRDVSLC